MKDRKRDEVFTDPKLEITLANGETLQFDKFIGMKDENKILMLRNELFNLFESEDKANISSIDNFTKTLSTENGAKILYEMASLITQKDVKFCEQFMGAPEIFWAVELFFQGFNRRVQTAYKTLSKTLDMNISTLSSVESGDGTLSKQT